MSESLIEKLAKLEEGIAKVRSAMDKQDKVKPINNSDEIKELRDKVDKLLTAKPVDIESIVEESIKKIVTMDFITKLYKG